MICFVVVTLFLIFAEVCGGQDAPEVQISQGVLKGKAQESRKGRTFYAFTGIPYAKPPLGELRFKAPVPAVPWEGVLDATKAHAVCPQTNPLVGDFSVMGNEDCLFLNVYTPQLPVSNKNLLPVLFYIHEGAFILGSGSPDWHGADIFLDKDIVLVTFNYRLGALGFLSTGDDVVPGNNGLKDQNLALKWTKSNIAAFGGDPERITVVGNFAGGASAHFHMLSPLSRDLINGVIAQSGSALAAWAFARNDEEITNAKRLATFLNCSTTSSKLMVDCLRKIDASDIVNQDVKFLEWALDPMIPFKPVIESKSEGVFLPENPLDIIKLGKAANVPLMTGITTEDGALKSSSYYQNPSWIEDIDKEFNRVVPLLLRYGTSASKDHLSRQLRKFYFGDKKIDNTTKDELTNLYTDVIFLLWADESVRMHFKHGSKPVYYYLFGYRGSESYSRLFGDATYRYGVCHSDELLYLFTLKKEFLDFKPSDTDKYMSEVLTTLWTNFVIFGNPTPEINSIIPQLWKPVQSDMLEYYFIKSLDKMEMSKGLYADRAKFIKELGLYSKKTIVKNEL